MKEIQQRLQESMQMHARLQSIGALVDEKNRDVLKQASNAYVKDGESASLKLRIDSSSNALVVFSAKGKCGVALENL